MVDYATNYVASKDMPGLRHYLITPSSNVLDPKPRALYINVGGTVTIEDELGVSLVYTVADGQVLAFRAEKVTAAVGAQVYAWV